MQFVNFTDTNLPEAMKNHDSVLIIDDEAEICFLLASMLKKRKMVTSIAHTLSDGYHKLNAETGILFLDINLPDGSGLDLLKRIREEQPGLKIIMISAYDGENERKEARQNGADAFIGKPFNSETIFQTIDELKIRA
jgi:two-component system, OmpR family, response regulator